MIKVRKTIIAAVAVLLVALMASDRCFAEGWGGGGNFSPGGAVGNNTTMGGKHATAWFHYEYIGGSELRGESIRIDNQWNDTSTPPTIDGMCAKEDVGFWILANSTNNEDTRGWSYKEPGGGCYSPAGYSSTQAHELWSKGFYRNETNCIAAGPEYVRSDGKMFYRNVDRKGYAPYETLSTNYATFSSNPGKGNISYNLPVARQELYLGKDAKGKAMYRNDKTASSPSQIMASYREYTRRDDTVEDILEGTISDEETYDKMVKRKGGSIFAFCSFDDAPKTTNLESKSQIEVYQGGVLKGGQTTVDWNGSTTKQNQIALSDNSVEINYNFSYRRNDSSFATNAIGSGSNIQINLYKSDGTTETRRNQNVTTPAFNTSVPYLGSMHAPSSRLVINNLTPNVNYKICASIRHPKTLSVSGGSTNPSGSEDSEACVNVIYEKPLVVAEIDADTVAHINSEYLVNSSTTDFSSHRNGGVDSYISTTVKVKPGPMKISWAHNIGYKNLQGSADKVLTKTYNIDGGGSLLHPQQVSAYTSPNSFSSYPWSYYYDNSDGQGKYPSRATSDIKNEYSIGVFPGGGVEVSQTLKHPSKVDVSTGDPAPGAHDEYSAVTLNLKADSIQCGLADGDWGVSGAHLKSIGVNNPTDYRWLRMRRDDNKSVVVGDDFAQQSALWLKPENRIRISQLACFGSQIGIDASNTDASRWTTNAWGADNGRTNNALNTAFKLGLTIGMKNTLVYGGSSGNTHTLSNQAWLQSSGGASLWASEIGNTKYKDNQVSTPMERIRNDYKISTESNTVTINNLGRSLNTTFSKPNGESVGIEAKIPYNYYLGLDLGDNGGTDVTLLDSDNSSHFVGSIESKARKNEMVCKGYDGGNSSSCEAYATESRRTQASMLVFTMNSSFDINTLKNGQSEFAVDGNQIEQDQVISNIKGRYGVGNFDQDVDYKVSALKKINDSESMKLESEYFNGADYAVGTKICAAIAAYPSDSHNTGDGSDITTSNQDAAFETYSGTLKTAYKVSCRTVAKHQTMSVEGNGIVSTEDIKSSETHYKDRIFKSWSEYQVLAGGSSPGGSSQPVSSGAVTAYALGNPATSRNERKGSADQYSVKNDLLLYPQSLGNYGRKNPRSDDEAKVNWSYSERLIDTIKSKYGVSKNGVCEKDSSSKNALRCVGDNYHLNNSDVSDVSLNDKDTITVRSLGSIVIAENLTIPSNSKRLIIIAKNIYIDRSVTEINAWLIVDGAGESGAGKFNTCAGDQDGEYKVYTIDDPKYYGNWHILQNCNAPLYINGPVIVNSTDKLNAIQLPRTYGGGSRLDTNGETITRDEQSYVERAEIFNYDPSVVEWAYNESKKEPQIVTTYTETLAPRL